MSQKKREINVLLLCDEPSWITTEKKCLETLGGLCVETVLMTHEALAKLEKNKPDVIVVDWSRTVDSILVESLRSENGMTPIIVFSYGDEKELFTELCKSGTVGFVDKSGDVEKVFSSLKSCIVAIASHHE